MGGDQDSSTTEEKPTDNELESRSDPEDVASGIGAGPLAKQSPDPRTPVEAQPGGVSGSTLNIVYRTDLAETYRSQVSLDVHYSEAGKVKPVVLFIHGGGWISGDKAEATNSKVAQLGDFFKDNGFVFVSANYRLVDVQAAQQGRAIATFREQASDVANAIAWVNKNIAKYGGDPQRLVLAGHSAGAHLAPLAVLDDRYLAEVGLSASVVRKVISLDVHAYDLPLAISLMTDNPDFSQQIPSLKRMFGQTTEQQLEASPSKYISAGKTMPSFLVVSAGMMRGTVHDLTKRTSQVFVDRLKTAGVKAAHYYYENETHSSLVSDINTFGDSPAIAVKAFILDRSLP